MTSTAPDQTAVRSAALMANFRTRNLGNLALTSISQQLMLNCYGVDQVRSVHRVPHAVADLVTAAPVDEWSDRLRSRIGDLRPDAVASAAPERLRVPEISPKGAERREEPWWRRPAVAAGHSRVGLEVRARRASGSARAHYRNLLGADDLIWIPGGEISTLTHPRNRLLDVEVALDAGLRVAMANFSFEPSAATESVFQSLAPRLTRVVSRDEISKERLISLGADPDRIAIVPDVVFMIGSGLVPRIESAPAGPRRDVVGIVLHGLTPLPKPEWRRLVEGVRGLGLDLEILSSHLEFDHGVIESLLEIAPDIPVVPEFTSVSSYIGHLQTLRGLVTARFHSAVMGITHGLSVAGVDSYGGKVAGALNTAGLSDLAADGADWPDKAIEILGSERVAGPDRLAACRSRIRSGYEAVFPMIEP